MSLALLLVGASEAFGQAGYRPADEAPDPPAPGESAEDLPGTGLRPSEEIPLAPAPAPLPAGLVIRPSGFEILGSTAFDEAELAALFAPSVGRPLSSIDLLALVDRLRQLYREAGFATTQVVLPDQDLERGIVRIRVIEGRIDSIRVAGTLHHRTAFFRLRLARATRAPLDVPRLTRQLELLQAEPGIERIAATLEELRPGLHRLHLDVVERSPYRVRARSSNHRSPSTGSTGGTVEVGHESLLGFGDQLWLSGQFSEGLRDFRASWQTPISPWDTRLLLAYRYGRADIVEDRFENLDIDGRFESVAIGLRQPLVRNRGFEAWLEVVGEWRKSTSSIFGRVECFQQDLRDCTPSAAILRTRADLSWRTRSRGVALRSTLSVGIDALGATTERDAGGRDGEFVSWLAQVQWAELLPRIAAAPWLDGSQLLLRGDLQLTNDPLLSIEQIAVGGARSVRGYRQNQIVRDNGAIASIELRVPVWRSGFDRPIVEIAPFVDYGSAWDRRRGRSPDETIVSTGLALRVSPTEGTRAELSWAHRFRNDLIEGDDLQREGIYFEVVWDVF